MSRKENQVCQTEKLYLQTNSILKTIKQIQPVPKQTKVTPQQQQQN